MIKNVPYNTGHKLAYAEYGDPDGFPILIQHGLVASIRDAYLFKRLVEAGRRVVCTARPGYGDSTPYEMKNVGEWGEIIMVLAEALGLQQLDVLGISSGAPYSYAIGFKLRGRVRNLFILSGTPALYDESVQAHWPYPLDQQASLEEMQKLAYELFFASLPESALDEHAIRDSMQNECFGPGLDLKIRARDWGFRLKEVKTKVVMRHSRADDAVPLVTAEMTAILLPDCQLDIQENEAHFSPAVLDDFIRTVVMQTAKSDFSD